MRDEVRVSLMQLAPAAGPEAWAGLAGQVVAEASGRPADLIAVAPAVAGELDLGPLADVARRQRVHVVAGGRGQAARSGDEVESVVLIGPRGEVLHEARRLHGGGTAGAPQGTTSASPPGLVATDLGTLALVTGHDAMFPELARVQALAGAEIVVSLWALPTTAAPADMVPVWCRSRATENFVYYLGCSLAGGERAGGANASGGYAGRSVVAAPSGLALAASQGRAPDVQRATLTAAGLRDQRLYQTIFNDRRTELYGDLVRLDDQTGSPTSV